MTSGTQGYAVALWVLLGLFVLRVAGQLLIAMGAGGFLPPWEEWFSGALPYPALLTSQLLILFLYGAIARDVTRGRGFFAVPPRRLGSALLAFGWLCFPRFDRNPNTGAPIATAVVTAVARQAVHHGRLTPSRIVLPVVPTR